MATVELNDSDTMEPLEGADRVEAEREIIPTLTKEQEAEVIALLASMETVDWNFEDLDQLEGYGRLLGQSWEVMVALEKVLKYAIDMLDTRVPRRFIAVIAAAYAGLPQGLDIRLRFYRYHFERFGAGFVLGKFAGEESKDELTKMVNGMNASSMGEGETEPRFEALTGQLLWHFLLNPKSATWTLLTQALEKEFLVTVIASVMRLLPVVAERVEGGLPIGVAAVRRLVDKTPEIVFKADDTGESFISLVAQLSRRGQKSQPFIDPTVLILHFIQPGLEKEMQAHKVTLMLKVLTRLVNHSATRINWAVTSKSEDAWEGTPTAPDTTPTIQLPVLLELLITLWVRCPNYGNACGRVRQLAWKSLRVLINEAGKNLPGNRLDLPSLLWLTEDRLNSFLWQYKHALLLWLPVLTDSVLPAPEVPQCLHDYLPEDVKASIKAIACGAHRDSQHRFDNDGKESCAMDSLFELFLVSEDAAIGLVKDAGLTLPQEDLESKLVTKLKENLANEEAMNSPDAFKGVVSLAHELDPGSRASAPPRTWTGTRSSMEGILWAKDYVFLAKTLYGLVKTASRNSMYIPGARGILLKQTKVDSLVRHFSQLFKEASAQVEKEAKELGEERGRSKETAAVMELFRHTLLLAGAYRKLPSIKKEPMCLLVLIQDLTKHAARIGIFRPSPQIVGSSQPSLLQNMQGSLIQENKGTQPEPEVPATVGRSGSDSGVSETKSEKNGAMSPEEEWRKLCEREASADCLELVESEISRSHSFASNASLNPTPNAKS